MLWLQKYTKKIVSNYKHIYQFLFMCTEFHVAHMQTIFFEIARNIWKVEGTWFADERKKQIFFYVQRAQVSEIALVFCTSFTLRIHVFFTILKHKQELFCHTAWRDPSL